MDQQPSLPKGHDAFGGDVKSFEFARRAIEKLEADCVPRRIWERDHTVWRDDPTEITDRLGWLTVAGGMREAVSEIQEFAADLGPRGVRDVVLIGMGGSSLAPEVLRRTFGSAPGYPRLHVLDSTSPARIRRVTAAVAPDAFHVLMASKSGSTIEVRTVAAHFLALAAAAGIDPPARAFTAITDPGTELDERAAAESFFRTFRNPPDIGGRFSALSCFGLVPAAVLGVDVSALLDGAIDMADACGPDVPVTSNPGAALGGLLAGAALAGRDKLGLLLGPSINSFGLWIEQLLAESFGKEGKGIVPVTDEPEVPVECLGADRMFVAVTVAGDDNVGVEARANDLTNAGHPVLHLVLSAPERLGAEMFRWEFATAVAGHLLDVQPFDQPDVQAAKAQTQTILETFARGQTPPSPESGDAEEVLGTLRPGDYVGLMVYGDPDDALNEALAKLRDAIQRIHHVPTTLGIGPRFLHSTGQLHKGGPNTGVFLQFVLEEGTLPIPGEELDFGRLIRAQADGDFAALLGAERRVVRVDAGADPAATVLDLARSVS